MVAESHLVAELQDPAESEKVEGVLEAAGMHVVMESSMMVEAHPVAESGRALSFLEDLEQSKRVHGIRRAAGDYLVLPGPGLVGVLRQPPDAPTDARRRWALLETGASGSVAATVTARES